MSMLACVRGVTIGRAYAGRSGRWSAAVGPGEYLHIVTGGILEIEASSVAVDRVLLLVTGVSPIGESAFGHPGEDGVEFILGHEEGIVMKFLWPSVVIVE